MTDPRLLPKLLYIEDMPEARALVRRVLAQDFVVVEAADPLTGLELALEIQPDLILLDVNLPQLSGREAAARLATLLPKTPLVAFSADVTSQARQRALAAGFAGYLTKPLDVDTFADQLREFLHGKRETLPDLAHHQQDFAAEVVARLEEKVRELTKTAERNAFLNEQNRRMVVLLQRRQQLLEAAARVAQICSSILELDKLLDVAAETICREYGFEQAALYLLDASGEWAQRRAAGELVRLKVGEDLLVGAAVRLRAAQLSSSHTAPAAPAEIALPLIVEHTPLGALFVRSASAEPFNQDDLTALQSLADQVAVAINNAYLLRDLHQANEELLRSKTFQAIATATGEAIHWVGNKAAPIPASARRVREDLQQLMALFGELLALPPEARAAHPAWPVAQEALGTFVRQFPDYRPPQALLPLGLESTFEDLTIIEQSAATILAIKEDLIGPVRLRQVNRLDVAALLTTTLFEMGLPDGVVQTDFAADLPPVRGDARQLGQVFNNLVKNAWEALAGRPQPLITVTARLEDAAQPYVQVRVADNGPGIPPELLEKIWVSFFTTKGDRGGTGLGLSACMAILSQMEGKISVESRPGEGAAFTVLLPAEVSNQ